MRTAREAGCHFVPALRTTAEGRTSIAASGHLWELVEWMPGEADFHLWPTAGRLAAAVQAVATFHRATESIVRPHAGRTGPAPSVLDRLHQLQADRHQQWRSVIDARHGAAIASICQRILDHSAGWLDACERQLAPFADCPVPLQPCLRDIWHDHILFIGAKVSGIIDYGAARVDTVATDLARLLGSLVPADPIGWQLGLQSYEQIRPLSPTERSLIGPLERASAVLAGHNWIRWLFVTGRTFASLEAVTCRLRTIDARLSSGP